MRTSRLGRVGIASRVRPFACAALVAAALGAPGFARAADARFQQDLEQAEQALVNLDYDAANKTATRLVQQRGLTHEQLVRSYRLLAITDAVLDKEAASREAFQQLLTYDPAYQGDTNLGPKVQGPFMEARGFMRAQAVQPGVEVAVVLRPAEPGTIRVTTRDPMHVARRAAVSYRWGGEGAFTTVAVPVSEGAAAEIPPPAPGTTRLDYYVQIFDDHDSAAFESGNASTPKSATMEVASLAPSATGRAPATEEHHSIFGSPIFWTITAVVLAGAGTGVYFATRSSTTTTQVLPPTGVSLGSSAQCGGQSCR